MPFNVGPLELVIVLAIALLVVGPRRLPEMGNAVGKTIREFRKASTEMTDAATLEPEAKPAATAESAPAESAPAAAAPAAAAPAAPAAPVAAAPAPVSATPEAEVPAAAPAPPAEAEPAPPAEAAPATEPKSDDA